MTISSRRTVSSIHRMPRPIAISNLRTSMVIRRGLAGKTPIKPPTDIVSSPPPSVGPIQLTPVANYDTPIQPKMYKAKMPHPPPRRRQEKIRGTGMNVYNQPNLKKISYEQMADGTIKCASNRDAGVAAVQSNHSND